MNRVGKERYIVFFVKVIILFLVIVIPTSGFCFLGMDVRNFSIGGGLNVAFKETNYPEVPHYTEPDVKKSFTIDLRFDLRLREWLRLVPDLGYWSWGRFPRQGMTGVESSLQCYGLNFDMQVISGFEKRFQLYGGLGLGMHYSRQLTQFPYEMFIRLPIVVAEITEKSLNIGPNISCGYDFRVTPGITLFQELRWEFVPGFQQLKILIGITTF